MRPILPIDLGTALTPPHHHRPMNPSRCMNRLGSKRQGLLACALLLTLSSCAQLSIRRDTETSGTFTSTGRSITFLSWEMPRPAIQIAQENAADASLPNIEATSVEATDWGWFDWILEIISTRSARVTGTWGYR